MSQYNSTPENHNRFPDASEEDLRDLGFVAETLWRLVRQKSDDDPLTNSPASVVVPETADSGATTRVFMNRNDNWVISKETWGPENEAAPDGPLICTTVANEIAVGGSGSVAVERVGMGADYRIIPGELVSATASTATLSSLACADLREHVGGLIQQTFAHQNS